jgi:hypothetical protein
MKKFLICITCSLGIISCTRLDFAVNWADTYIASQVDDYFDLTSQQNKDLKESLTKDIRRIRKEKFPLWAEHLHRFEKDLRENNLTGERFHKYFVESLETSKTLQPYFTTTAVTFISTATLAQLEHFERTLRKKNIEDKEQIQNRQKARNETRKKYLRWTDLGIDTLSKDQEQLLNQHLNDHPFPAQAQIKNKAYILEKFNEARKSPEGLKNFVRSYYDNKSQLAAPEYRQALGTYQIELEKFIFQLVQSLNEKQKRFLSEQLLEKASSLKKLAAKD